MRLLEKQLGDQLHRNNNKDDSATNQTAASTEQQVVTKADDQVLPDYLFVRSSSLSLPSYILKKNVIRKLENNDQVGRFVTDKVHCSKNSAQELTDTDADNLDFNDDDNDDHGDGDDDGDDDDDENSDHGDNDVSSDGIRNEMISFYCVVCEKTLRSKKTVDNHEKSKKHKENVRTVERKLHECSIECLTPDATVGQDLQDNITNEDGNDEDEEEDEEKEEDDGSRNFEDIPREGSIYSCTRNGSLSLPSNIIKRNLINKISSIK